MKRLLLISLALLALLAPLGAHGAPKTYTVLLAGGDEANTIKVWLTPDGRQYVIDSVVQLEVGGTICANPVENPNELICDAPSIAGFEVNAGGGDDRVAVAKNVVVPAPPRIATGTTTFFATAPRSSPPPALTSKPAIEGASQISSFGFSTGFAQMVPPTSSCTTESITYWRPSGVSQTLIVFASSPPASSTV